MMGILNIIQLKLSFLKRDLICFEEPKYWHFISGRIPIWALGRVHADDVHSSVARKVHKYKKRESTISWIGRHWRFDVREVGNPHYH